MYCKRCQIKAMSYFFLSIASAAVRSVTYRYGGSAQMTVFVQYMLQVSQSQRHDSWSALLKIHYKYHNI